MSDFEIFSPRDPGESRVLTISFAGANRLQDGETIVSATWLIEHDDGTASTATAGTCDTSTHPLVKAEVTGGTHNTTDLHRARAVTSTGRVILAGGHQSVYKGA